MHAVGADYTSWEGYVEEDSGRAVIGLSYAKLCQFLKPGNTILLSDGTITIQVCDSTTCSATAKCVCSSIHMTTRAWLSCLGPCFT